ncbi:unnamed protein product [Leuciscus chuanchicus]
MCLGQEALKNFNTSSCKHTTEIHCERRYAFSQYQCADCCFYGNKEQEAGLGLMERCQTARGRGILRIVLYRNGKTPEEAVLPRAGSPLAPPSRSQPPTVRRRKRSGSFVLLRNVFHCSETGGHMDALQASCF